MERYTVKQVAQMARISIRTLHHYDNIGLLKPAHIGENGYRYYGRAELLRLQQILIHRELDIPLAQIGAILDDPAFDRLAALESQRIRVVEQAGRLTSMLRTIDRTIAEIKGDRAMKDADLYSGVVDPQKQAEYEAWLEQRFGPDIKTDIAVSLRRMDQLSDAKRQAAMDELRTIEEGLAEALRKGIPPQSHALESMIARHWNWVQSSWNQPAPVSAYAGLADVYLAHPDFVARYESIETGFAQYLAAAMKSWAARQQ
ncbi:MerR family transcriptional regulator [Pelagibacterium halotolerans]|uniref:Transcriptional regulator, MerR family n=1 Tax=Pelagibacterium halotolerans (strain DSM 22347 / JCM 15775 / CGMCC 1.7692 / B2) TaxID=1082931 RepID=G4RDK5_PELHB|nr:MerR family transcriptional regulator [Pelagibacterium halotolerans]AEQ51806.1 transcriptional regulator, MerR family [Pelagibacterium halotolerans B2]QJR18384.1 MerR family transcriptional regulator [Pelagibacterium halotolerans]SEA23962.1 DNA-binding transcriptional regulator, MerR family [Pelagibacterium halotolerans]